MSEATIPQERTTSAPKKPLVENTTDALALLRLQKEAEEFARRKADLEDTAKWQYYVRCYRCHENGQHHIGVFLTKDPGSGPVHQDEWFSSYKNRSDPWYGDVLCQECYAPDADGEPTGAEFQLRVRYTQSTKKKGVIFEVPVDHLFRYAKDPEIAKKYGKHRAHRVAYRSGNEHFAPMENENRAPKEAVRG